MLLLGRAILQEPVYYRRRLVTQGLSWLRRVLCLLILSSVQFPELSVASYNKNAAAVNEPDGVVAVWNLHLLERPEFVFHSQVCYFSRPCI